MSEEVQCYKVIEGKLYIRMFSRNKIKKSGYFESPIDALEKSIRLQKQLLADETLRLNNRKSIVDSLESTLNDYLIGNQEKDIFNRVDEETNSIDIYSEVWKRMG